MLGKWVALVLLIAAVVASLSIAGCTSPTSSNQAAPNTSTLTSTASSTATASTSATPPLAPSPSPSQLPTSSPTPSAITTPTPTGTPSPSFSPSAGYVVYYFHEVGCPYCAAFENTSNYAQLTQQPNFTPVLNTDTGMVQQYAVKVYPTVVLVKNGAVVGTWEYPDIDAATILAQET